MTNPGWEKVTTVQIVANALTAQIYWHNIPYRYILPCWTYITRGFRAHGQKELVLTLFHDPLQRSDAHDFLPHLLKHIFDWVQQGHTMEAGSYTKMTLTEDNQKQVIPLHLFYLPPIPIPGLPIPPDALTVRFVESEECTFSETFGMLRLCALWAKQHQYFPTPPWSEIPLPLHLRPHLFQDSILTQVPRLHLLQSAVTIEGKTIVFRLRHSACALLAQHLAELPLTEPIALLTGFDAEADSGLVWLPPDEEPSLNTTAANTKARILGCFMLFLPEEPTLATRVIEDGCGLFMPTQTWAVVRQALVQGTALNLEVVGLDWRLEHVAD